MDLRERFDEVKSDYLKFGRVVAKKSRRPDLHAMLLLDELFPASDKKMVCSAEHDEICFEPSGEKLNELTDAQILELTRCGVQYNEDYEYLSMFI